MARPPRSPASQEFLILWQTMRRRRVRTIIVLYLLMVLLYMLIKRRRSRIMRSPCWYDPVIRNVHLSNMIEKSDTLCLEQIRMDRRCFKILCSLIRDVGGLKDSRNMSVEEMVAIFLHIIAYDEKNREIKFDFLRSQETISRRFHDILKAILKLWRVLLKTPQPITEDCKDERWKWFKNCLGALDGTYIKVNVPDADQPRYRCRKNFLATNVLGVCAPDMQFIYVLSGWEGSAADGRILRDALSRPNGLKVPPGFHFLVDGGYKHCEGFLAPYRGERYHLHEWTNPPIRKEELFNMRHSSARNVIERTFGLLKIRWGILRNPSYYTVKTHSDIVLACCYLHNLIRQQMGYEPIEQELEDYINRVQPEDNHVVDDNVESSVASDWGQWRDQLAEEMWSAWQAKKSHKMT